MERTDTPAIQEAGILLVYTVPPHLPPSNMGGFSHAVITNTSYIICGKTASPCKNLGSIEGYNSTQWSTISHCWALQRVPIFTYRIPNMVILWDKRGEWKPSGRFHSQYRLQRFRHVQGQGADDQYGLQRFHLLPISDLTMEHNGV